MSGLRRIMAGNTFGRMVPGINEELWAPRYDYHVVNSVQAFTEFFGTPVGCETPHGVKTARDTNMLTAYTMPQGQCFMATGIRVLFIPDALAHRGHKASDEQDAKRMLLGGSLRFDVGNRVYLEDGPLAKFPTCLPRTWMGELAFLSPEDEEAHWQVIYDPSTQRIANLHAYNITPIFISQHQFFRVQIMAEPQPLNAPGKLGVILDGHVIRERA